MRKVKYKAKTAFGDYLEREGEFQIIDSTTDYVTIGVIDSKTKERINNFEFNVLVLENDNLEEAFNYADYNEAEIQIDNRKWTIENMEMA